MRKPRFTDEQCAYALKQAEQCTPVRALCRQLGVWAQAFCSWKKR